MTVAEIADAASISVKTFFTYFRSKEDLALADDHRLLEQILEAVRARPTGTSPADAVGDLLVSLLTEGEGLQGLLAMATGRRSPAARRKALQTWATGAAAQIRDGIGNFLARPAELGSSRTNSLDETDLDLQGSHTY